MNIGKIIKELSVKKNITAVELAEYFGKSRDWAYKIYRSQHISTEFFPKLCEIFDVPPSFFLKDLQGKYNQKMIISTVGEDQEKYETSANSQGSNELSEEKEKLQNEILELQRELISVLKEKTK